MTPEVLFRLASTLALLSWIVLAGSLFLSARLRRLVSSVITGAAVPLLFAVLYTGLIVSHWPGHRGGFNSLEDVMALFTDRWLVLAGWVHYLAFDLFVGSWEAREGQRIGLPGVVVLPCLLLTFLFGPIGWLLFLVARTVRVRNLVLTAE